MGIHDRDYIRRPAPGGPGALASRGLGAVGMLSVNTWIIILCVAVFVIEGMTPWRPVLGRQHLFEGAPTVNLRIAADRLTPNPPPAQLPAGAVRPGLLYAPIVHDPTQSHVGWAEFYPMRLPREFLHFSTQRGFFQIEFWRLIGFQFLHADLMHLLFNMIGLFFFGPLVERHLGSKRYLAFYLLCGICGALLYSALNVGGQVATIMLGEDVSIPGLLFNDPYTPLIGASAGVFGVLMAGAYLAPHVTVLLFFILPMKLRTVAYGLVLLALWRVITGGYNAGGEAGHLGGAIAGFYFIRKPHHLHGFFDFLGRADPTSHHYRHRKPGKAVRPDASQREVDRILDKINREGIQSLTDEEKRILREASRR